MDYSDPLEAAFVFQPGENRTCVSIPIIDDQIFEPVECFSVNAQPRPDGRSLLLIDRNTTVCIEDDGMKLCVSCASNRVNN